MLPDWAITLISVAASAVVSGVVGYIIKRSLDKYFKKKDDEAADKEKKLQELKRLQKEQEDKRFEEMVDRIVGKHITPVKEDVVKINDKLHKIEEGTLDTLRDRILSAYYKCVEKGYRTRYDYENVHHMFNDYLNLEGNSFVEDCIKTFDSLPPEEQYKKELENSKKQTKTRAKKVLVENK